MLNPALCAVVLLVILTMGTAQVSVRLVGGPSPLEGRVEVYYNDTWGTVCYHQFDDLDAKVVCYMLGCGHYGRYIGQLYGTGGGPTWLSRVQCRGTETNIADCEHNGWGSHTWRCRWYKVSVLCPWARLVGGTSAQEGRLEVYHNGTWGTVCDNGFNDAAARVVCHMLRYEYGWFINNRYGAGSGQIWLDDVQCNGTETNIENCQHNGWGNHSCDHYKDVSVSCIMVRLVGSSSPREGRLEVYYNDTWGTVCHNHFNDTEAKVVCNMLGYRNGGQFIGNRYGSISGQIWMGDIRCNGMETNIASCQHGDWGSHNCSHNTDISVSCFCEVRLVGDSGSRGRLEVYHNGTWGTVCENGFTDTAAKVVCHSLGYGYTGQFIGNHYGAGNGNIWLENIRCNGSESHITECPNNGWGPHSCSHSDDVSVSCIADSAEAVALVGGGSPRVGRLEVFHGSQWGTVCGDGFTDAAARVVCYSLGFGYVGRKVDINLYGLGNGLIWLNNVICTGREQHIGNCSHGDWGFNNCSHHQDVAISCNITTPFTLVRLVGGSKSIGRLEVLHDSIWGTVCEDFFTAATARVVCRMFGFVTGTKTDNRNYTISRGKIWLDAVRCNGTETDIADCSHRGWGVHNCEHHEDVAVSCSGIHVRLNGGRDPREGRLEVLYNGVWGSVCRDGFNDVAARVVCNMLGFGYVGGRTLSSYGSAHGQTWVNSFQCSGREESVDECISGGWSDTYCLSGAQAISCLTQNAVALFGGQSPREGRLEVYHSARWDSRWGTVCDDGFSDTAARVVCYSLGFGYVGREMHIYSYGVGKGTIWLDDTHCDGMERHIGECSHRGWGVSDCEHREDAAVSCVAVLSTTSTASVSFPTSTLSSTSSTSFLTSSVTSTAPSSPTVVSTTSVSPPPHLVSFIIISVLSRTSTASSVSSRSSKSSLMLSTNLPLMSLHSITSPLTSTMSSAQSSTTSASSSVSSSISVLSQPTVFSSTLSLSTPPMSSAWTKSTTAPPSLPTSSTTSVSTPSSTLSSTTSTSSQKPSTTSVPSSVVTVRSSTSILSQSTLITAISLLSTSVSSTPSKSSTLSIRSPTSTRIGSSSHHDPYTSPTIIAAIIVSGLIICVIVIGLIVVHIHRNQQHERTEAAVIPMHATAVNSNYDNDAFDDATKYQNPSDNIQDSDNHAYSQLKPKQSLPVSCTKDGVDSGDIFMYHKPSARYESLSDDQQHSSEVQPSSETVKGIDP